MGKQPAVLKKFYPSFEIKYSENNGLTFQGFTGHFYLDRRYINDNGLQIDKYKKKDVIKHARRYFPKEVKSGFLYLFIGYRKKGSMCTIHKLIKGISTDREIEGKITWRD